MFKITELPNEEIKVHNSINNLDKQLSHDIPHPLPNYNGFSLLICGPSGSGKTTFLYSIMSKKKKNGVRQSYRGLFDKIYVISPTIGKDSIKNDPFKTLPDDQIHRSLSSDLLDELDEELNENRANELNSVVILDDVGSQLRKNQKIDKKLTSMIQNRRHQYTSYIIILQRFRDAGTGIRNNLSHFVTFRPKNKPEQDAISNELFPYDNKKNQQILNHIFESDNNFSFLFVDMSLKTTNKFLFYNGFNPLQITTD